MNGEGESRGQPADPGSPGKWLLKWSVHQNPCFSQLKSCHMATETLNVA